MGLPFLSKDNLIVGIDIGSHSVKICQLKRTGKGYTILALGSILLPEGAVDEGMLIEPELVAEAISTLLSNLKIKNKKVGFSISGYSVIVKKIKLPIMEEADLEEHIMAEAEQYIPFDIEDVYLDFQMLQSNENDPERSEVMLVAAKKEVVDGYLEMFEELNIQPALVDVDSFALENTYEHSNPGKDNVVLVDIGASKMNINVLSAGLSAMARDVVVGSRQLTEQIQATLDIEFDEAEALKLGKTSVEEYNDQLEKIFTSTCTQWVLEIKKIIDLYDTKHPDSPLTRLVLSGGGSKIVGLEKFLATETGLKVELFNPLSSMHYNPKKIDPEYIERIGPEMAIASGIAIRPSVI